ncbi:MAG TPA: urease accessory protein UreD [Hyphomicrobiaceae bacterium]|nr:urease accessory protein UreD [Hyphomicrobiaceae bacterium]
MSAVASLSESREVRDGAAAIALAPVRQIGGVDIRFARRGATTVAMDRAEAGGYRVRTPSSEFGAEAVLMNTGGGLVGGDRAEQRIALHDDAVALVTTSAAERVYRSLGPPARVAVDLTVAEHARLAWLPQETILYDGARLERTIDASIAGSGTLLAAEVTALGRRASGEQMRSGAIMDRWRIRRDGRLAYADSYVIDGALDAMMARRAVGAGASVFGTLLYLAHDAETQLDAVRAGIGAWVATAGTCRAAASAWNGMLVMRLQGSNLASLRALIVRVVPRLLGRPMPRNWWS